MKRAGSTVGTVTPLLRLAGSATIVDSAQRMDTVS
jgi:hypothetical protein